MELTRKSLLLGAYKVNVSSLLQTKLTMKKCAPEQPRRQVATWLSVLSQYTQDEPDKNLTTPEGVEKCIESATMSEQCMALLGNMFTSYGVCDAEDKGISTDFTVDENRAELMQLSNNRNWPIAPNKASPKPPSVWALGGQFPEVLHILGCSWDGVGQYPSLMSAPLVSRLPSLYCHEVNELFTEIDVCLRCLKRVRLPQLMKYEFLKDEVAAVIPMYRWPAVCLRDYALSPDATKWYYDYLCSVEYDCFEAKQEFRLSIPFLVGLSMLRALEEEESNPPAVNTCPLHRYDTYIYQRVLWTMPLARLCGIVPSACCEKNFWGLLRENILLWLAGNLEEKLNNDRDLAERVLTVPVINRSRIKSDSSL
ncbi:hypothetical protein DM02DRAFT_663001 [Periconia macrospinosa]|uniref:Uncharacterized protein n=1 Tax=Periconia macrospinosa TaxID=97972 RepID=A0A2V1D309_9PLEO|nr:hypothetical protein DM02DRAFT_663001 [Periconia macrospinosa]